MAGNFGKTAKEGAAVLDQYHASHTGSEDYERVPAMQDMLQPFDAKLIIEFYSR